MPNINHHVLGIVTVGDFGSVDTMQQFYKEGTRPTLFLRIIRICFVVPAGGAAYGATSGHLPGPPQLTYRTFLPALVRQGATFSIAVHEPMSNTRQRLEAWLRHTGEKPLHTLVSPSSNEIQVGSVLWKVWSYCTILQKNFSRNF